MTTIIQQLLGAGIPVIESESNEKAGEYSFGLLTDNQQDIVSDILNPPDCVELRRREYPSIGDQLDMIYHDAEDGTSLWMDEIKKVKEKYPKQEEDLV